MFQAAKPFYSIMILLALVANIIVVALISNKYSIVRKEIICLLLYENVGMIMGAKILTYLQNYNKLKGEFNFLNLGLTSYGAVIGAALFLALFTVQFKKSFKEIIYIFMPSMPLMYGIGKIGCFLAGCCYGIQYNGPGSVVYNYSYSAPKHIHLFPIQIVETAFFIGVFIYMIIKSKKDAFSLKTVGLSFILCALGKFILEFFRSSHRGQILSLNQIISILFIFVGIGTIKIKNQKLGDSQW